MSTRVIGGAPPAAWQGPGNARPHPQDTPFGRIDNRPSTMRFKLIVDD
jgi:hypothetical protein